MDPRTRPSAPRQYETFDPQMELVAEEGAMTFLVHLPEFRKEQLKVQLSSSRTLRISGECPLGDDKWKRFVTEVRIPEDCDPKGIVAKFDRGILYVKQPKLVAPVAEPQPAQVHPNFMPAPEPTLAPVAAPSNTHDKMEEEPRKEDDQTTMEDAKEDQDGMASGDTDNADLRKNDAEETGQVADEQGKVVGGGIFEEVMQHNTSMKLLLIGVLVVALVLQIMYA